MLLGIYYFNGIRIALMVLGNGAQKWEQPPNCKFPLKLKTVVYTQTLHIQLSPSPWIHWACLNLGSPILPALSNVQIKPFNLYLSHTNNYLLTPDTQKNGPRMLFRSSVSRPSFSIQWCPGRAGLTSLHHAIGHGWMLLSWAEGCRA